MWFTEAYIENIFNKVIFKTFILKNAEKKCPNILPRPGSSRQDSLFSPEQITCYIGSVEKNNLTAKKTKRFNLIQKIIPPQKSYGRHFEIIIELKKLIISLFK